VLILVVWAGSLGWLIKREYFRSSGARLAEAARAVSPGALFYRLSLGAQQIGYLSTTVDTLVDSFRVVDVLVVDVPALGRLDRTEGRSVAILDRALQLRSVSTEVDGDVEHFTATLTPSRDSLLHLALVAESDSQTSTVPLAGGGLLTLPSLLPLRLAFGGELHPGGQLRAHVFDPFTLTLTDANVRITAESTFIVPDSAAYDSTTMAWVPVRFDTVRAFRADPAAPASGASSAWIDAQGRVVRADAPRGFQLERTAFEIAYENFRRRDTLRLMRATATPSPNAIVAVTAVMAGVRPDSGTPPLWQVRVGTAALTGLDLTGGRQRLAGDTVVITRERGVVLRARYRLPAEDSSLRASLRPELLIESTDLRVQAQARQIAAGSRDPGRVAERLAHWVATEVRRDARGAPPSALLALLRRRGDGNAHVALFVALARALGLPARPVAGLLYAQGRFYYHAWAEVYLNGWVALDPTFDQFPADATRLRLVRGEMAQPVSLVRLVGRLTLEVP
jgi:transglutaminase-like putative cysteine protease